MKDRKKATYNRIDDTSATYERVGEDEVERSLSAAVESSRRAVGGSPYSIGAIRSRLASELTSTGGRPSRKEVAATRKIPLTKSEWNTLDEITQIIRSQGVSATPGQVAGVLLHQSMTEVVARLAHVAPVANAGASATRSNNDLEEKVERILAAAASAEENLEQLKPIAQELLMRMRASKASADTSDEP